MTSRLFYHGTDEEMQLGDRIAIRSMGSDKVCIVTCIRGVSATDSDPGHEAWAFQTDDGVFHAVEFGTGQPNGQVGRNIRLVCHPGGEIEAAAEALSSSSEKDHSVSWWDVFSVLDLGCGVFVALGLIVNVLVWFSLRH